jgi:primosomal protein N' (replication factor Y)
MLVEVALNAVGRDGATPVLTYRVPQRLSGRIGVGQLVWAPLRRRRVQGVVLRVAADDPSSRAGLRELDDLADPAAQILPAGLQLAEWVAATYRAPLYEALALLLPPGVGQEALTTWRATASGLAAELGALPERERAVLYYLRSHGEQSEDALRKALRGTDADLRAAYAALYERGLISHGATISARKARPRRVPVARLTLSADQLPAALEELTRAPRQQAALRWIAEQGAGYGDDGGASFHRDDAPALLPLRAITAATGATSQVLRELERRGLIALDEVEVRRDPLAATVLPPDAPPPLHPAQRSAYEKIVAALETGSSGQETGRSPSAFSLQPSAFLLHGITGSGKTEIYLRTIGRAIRLGRQALVLVPEIALTAQLVRRFAARFPGQVAVLHSGLSLGERYDEWRRLRRGEARVAIGSRSAAFAPLPDLGLIVVDEEHELTYKADRSPRYHARAVAEALAAITGSVLVLGSATPSVESYYAVQTGRYTLLELHERVGSAPGPDGLPRIARLPLPPVRLVDMRRELQSGNRSIFSRPLQQALAETLDRGDQAILFLNRRGAASFVMCRDCGHVMDCPACSGPLTVHYAGDAGRRTADEPKNGNPNRDDADSIIVCHSCGFRALIPGMCPHCLSPRIRSFGIGTQRVAEAVNELLPQARVLRWDRDSVAGKGAHDRLLDAFLQGKADVLVGTQMIAKGLDLPRVALVGVVAADTGLHLPDFRSGERAFQLLTQVAGRAGRRTAGAQVIIQSYNPEHYALQAAQEHDYAAFYTQEIAFRRATSYPPFGRLVRFVYAAGSEAAVRREADRLAERLHARIDRRGPNWGLVGPAPAFLQRMRGRWRWHLILRTPADVAPDALNALLDDLGPLYGWQVDVDPVHVL